jgi:hypothetical protein
MIRSILLALMMAFARADYTGVWKMTVATTPLRAVELPGASSTGVTMQLEKKDDETYKVMFHGGNIMIGGMQIEEKLSDTAAKVTFSSFSSTRMMPPPAYQQAESFITSSIPQVTSIQVDSDGLLVLQGDDANLSAMFERVAN